MGRFINADDTAYLGADSTLVSYNLFIYCGNNPVSKLDPTGCTPKWWENILIGAAVIAVAAVVTAAIVTTGGGAAAVLVTAGKIALGVAKVAATAGAVAGTVRVARSLYAGETDVKELGKDFVVGFSDGFYCGSFYSAGYIGTSLVSYGISGQINNGYGWSIDKWEGGYQTSNTPGISIATYKGGVNGGRTFGLDMDIYNGLHYHTNQYGTGKKIKLDKGSPLGSGRYTYRVDCWIF